MTSYVLRRSWAVLSDALGHLNDDDGWAMASHVALQTLMAVFPFLIFVAALAGSIGEGGLAARVASLLFEAWPKEIAGPMAADVRSVLGQARGGLLTVSIVVTLYLASNGVEAVRTALNRAYRVTESRNFLILRAQSVVFVVIGAFTSLSFAFFGVLGPFLFDKFAIYFPSIRPFSPTFDIFRYSINGVLSVVFLVAAHLWLPASRPPALRLWPGIAATLLLWLVAGWAFALYLGRFANYEAYYAGLASVFTAIFFLYLVALIMIFGAEFNAALARFRGPAPL